MMRSHLLSITLGLSLLLVAVPVQAQSDEDAPILNIEDVLLQNVLNGGGRPTSRRADEIDRMQKESLLNSGVSDEQLAAQQAAEAAAHAAAQEQEGSFSMEDEFNDIEVNGNTVTLRLSAADLRLLARIRNDRLFAGALGSLYSGAPLTPTGPGAIIMAIALALAIGGTYLWSWKMEKENTDRSA